MFCRLGPSPLAKNDPVLLAQSDPLLKQDLEQRDGFRVWLHPVGALSNLSSAHVVHRETGAVHPPEPSATVACIYDSLTLLRRKRKVLSY